MTVKDGDIKASKACKRCVVRKRKPQCSNCSAAAVDCFYASDVRKRGPVAGFAKAAERRAAVCEDALIFVLGLPGVREALENAQTKEIDTVTIRPESSAELSEYWECHPLSSALDIEQFRTACLPAESSKAYPRPLGRQSDNSIGVETSYIRQERDLQDLQDLQTYQGALDHFAVPLVSPATATRPPSRSGGTAHLSMFQLPPSSSLTQTTQMHANDRNFIPPDPQHQQSDLLLPVIGQDEDLFW